MTQDETVRRQLGESVTSRLRAEIPGISAHVGEDYQVADDPEAALYRRIGAHFHWVAFAFAPWRMWDLHVGVVAVEGKQLSIGFHISERAGDLLLKEIEALGAGIGARAEHRPGAVEYQANLPLADIDPANIETLARTIGELCRKMAPLATRVAPTGAMRA